MNYATALQMVIADQRESWSEDEMNDDELIQHVKDGISITSSGPGWVQLDDDGSELAEAYKIILSDANSRDEVITRTKSLTEQLIAATDEARIEQLTRYLQANYMELTAIMLVRVEHNL